MKTKPMKIYKNLTRAVSLGLFVAGVCFLPSCGTKINYGQFQKDEIIISIGEDFNVSDFYDIGDYEIDYVSSDEKVVSKQEDIFKAQRSGAAYIYSVYDGKNVGYVKVVVKEKFLAPSMIVINDEGVLSWEKISVDLSSEKIFARYQLEIINLETGEKVEVECDENFYQLSQKGIYQIRIKALGNDYVDDSEFSEVKQISYAIMPKAENISFVADYTNGISGGVLSWDYVDGAKYNVFIENTLIETMENSINVDLTPFNATNLNVYIETIDINQNKTSSRSSAFVIERVSAPEPVYSNGGISWVNIPYAEGYFVKCVGSQTYSYFVADNYTELEDVPSGDYEFFVQAVGSANIANSSFAKLSRSVFKTPISNDQISLSKEGTGVRVTAKTNQSYFKSCKFFVGGDFRGEVNLTSSEDDFVAEKTFSFAQVGKYDIQVMFIPKELNSSRYYINSVRSDLQSFYVLGEIPSMEIDQTEDGMILSFSRVANAEDYSVKLNNKDALSVFEEKDGEIYINLGEIDRNEHEIVDGGVLNVKITSTRDEKDNTKDSVSEFNINVLSAPILNKKNGADTGEEKYSWVENENANYTYILYKTGADFSVDGTNGIVVTREEPFTEELEEGFYVIKIFATAKDKSTHIASQNCSQDSFVISRQIDQVFISDLIYLADHETNKSGYEVLFEIPELEEGKNYLRKYQIYVDDDLVFTGDVTNPGNYSYKFSNEYSFASGESDIKIRVVCPDNDLKKVYTESEFSVLKVTKLPTIQDFYEIADDQKLLVGGNQITRNVSFVKDGEEIDQILGDEKVGVDLQDFYGEFQIEVKFNGYKTYTTNFTNSQIYLDSDVTSLTFVKDVAPTQLKYENGIISFAHEGQSNCYHLTMMIKTQNDPSGKVFECDINAKSFDFEDISQIMESEEFDNYFSQKTEVYLEVYSKINQVITGKHYISSKTTSAGFVSITISKNDTILAFGYDKASNQICWNYDKETTGTVFDVFYKTNKVATISTPIQTGDEYAVYGYSLSSIAITEGINQNNEFYVVARSINKFDSNESQTLNVKKLDRLSSVAIEVDNSNKNIMAVISIPNNLKNYVSKMVVNNEECSQEIKSVYLSENEETVTVKLVGRSSFERDGVIYVFIDSEISTFTVNKSTADYSSSIQIVDGEIFERGQYQRKLQWAEYTDNTALDLIEGGVDFESLRKYRLYVGSSYKDIDTNYVDLNDEIFTSLSEGEYTVSVYVHNINYTVKNNGIGVYYFNELSTIPLKKSGIVENVSAQIENISTGTIDEEKGRDITFSWDFDDTAFTNVKYELRFIDASGDVLFNDTTSNKTYTINQEVVLGGGTLYIRVFADDAIFSNVCAKTFDAFDITGITLSDAGVLSASGVSDTELIICVTYGSTVTNVTTTSLECDIIPLLNYIGANTTQVAVDVVAKGKNQTFASKVVSITKDALGEGVFKRAGNEILFENSDADSVVVLYNQAGETKQQVLTGETVYRLVSPVSDSYYYYVSQNYKLVGEEYESTRVFSFAVPADAVELDYYFVKEGKVNSYYSKTLSRYSRDFDLQENLIDDVRFALDDSTKLPVGWVTLTNGSVENIYLTVEKEVLGENEQVFACLINQNEISLDDIIKSLNFGVGRYSLTVKVKSSNNEVDALSFDLQKSVNEVENVYVDDYGYLEWNQTENNRYVVNQTYEITTNWFDIVQISNDKQQNVNYSVADIGNIPFGTVEGLNYASAKDLGILRFAQGNANGTLTGLVYTPDIIGNIETDEQGNLLLNVGNADDYGVTVEYNNKLYPVSKIEKVTTSSNFLKIRQIDIIDAIGEDFNDDISSITLSIYKTGFVKSTSVSIDVNFKHNNNLVSIVEKQKGENDLSEKLYFNQTTITGDIDYNYSVVRVYENGEVLYDAIVNVQDNKIDINAILIDELDMKSGETYVVTIAPIIKDETNFIQLDWQEAQTYYRLQKSDNVSMSTEGDKIEWRDAGTDHSGYHILRERTNFAGENQEGVSSFVGSSTRGISTTLFEESYYLKFKVARISSIPGEIYSEYMGSNTYLENKKIDKTKTVIKDGVLKIEWNEWDEDILDGLDLNNAEIIESIFNSGDLNKILKLVQLKNNNISGVSQGELINKILSADILSPITFKLANLKEDRLEIRLQTTLGDSFSGVVSATEILERIPTGYLTALRSLPNDTRIESLITLLTNDRLFTGVASNELLFDEISGGAFEGVVAGRYDVYILQKGNQYSGTLQGDEIKAFSSTEVLKAPEMMLEKVPVMFGDNELTNNYFINFKTVKDLGNNQINSYKLVTKTDSKLFVFDINYTAGQWKLTYGMDELILTVEGEKVKIPLSSFASVMGLNSIKSFETDTYKASIYACGDASRFNGKSDLVNVAYYDIKEPQINNGEITWNSGLSQNFRVIYQKLGSTDYSIKNLAANRYSLETSGKYNFLAFLSVGSIRGYNVYIDSKIYMLQDLFKLYNPSLSTQDGEIVITDNANNIPNGVGNSYQRIFKVTNSFDESEPYIETEDATVIYRAGTKIVAGDEKKTHDKESSVFEIENIGLMAYNLVEDGLMSDPELGSVTKLKLEGYTGPILLKSGAVTIDAKMLQNATISINNKGDFVWNAEDDGVPDGYKIVYKVNVDRYRKTNTNNNGLQVESMELQATQTFYTTEKELSSELVNIENEDYYKIYVTSNVYSTEANNLEYITDILGTKYYIVNGAQFDGGGYILKSEDSSPNGFIPRMNEVSNININEGIITWDSNDSDAEFEIYCSTNIEGNNMFFVGSYASGANLVDANLSPNVQYYLWIKTINNKNERISSLKTKYDGYFYKLPTFNKEQLSISSQTQGDVITYTLDFSKYLDGINNILGNKNYLKFKLELDRGETTKDVLLEDLSDLKMYLTTGATNENDRSYNIDSVKGVKVTLLAKDTSLVLNSDDSEEILFEVPQWTEEDKISWDETTQTFVWTYEQSTTTPLYFDIDITTVSVETGRISTVTTTTTQSFSNVNDYRFKPILLGKITKVSIVAKYGEKNLGSRALMWEDAEGKEFKLFESGTGNSNDPYIIKTKEQFQNISLRATREKWYQNYNSTVVTRTVNNNTGSTSSQTTKPVVENEAVFCFKQIQDLTFEVSGFVITEDFEGVYDGDDKIITVNENGLSMVNLNIWTSDGSSTKTVSEGTALFKSVGHNGEVKNIKLNLTISQIGEDAVLSGLILENYGNVENIEVLEVNNLSSQTVGTTFIGLVVAMNYGNVINCSNEANINISGLNFTADSLFTISGIAVENRGLIERSINNKNITVNYSGVISTNIKIAGISLTNISGRIYLSGNNGDLNCSKASISGICLYSSSGEINYSWNCGNITAKNGAGICYNVSGSQIRRLLGYGNVNNSHTKLFFESFSGNAINCYSYSDYNNNFNNMSVTSSNDNNSINVEGYVLRAEYDGETGVFTVSAE